MQTLDLLYQMTNPINVEVIVDKQLFYLRNATDEYLRSDLVGRIRYASGDFSLVGFVCVCVSWFSWWDTVLDILSMLQVFVSFLVFSTPGTCP